MGARRWVSFAKLTGRAVRVKDDGTVVTDADVVTERVAREIIRRQFPADGILGEELGDDSTGTNRFWIIDPIDGTHSFVHKVPLWGTLVGLEVNGDAVLGVVYMPALDEMVYAVRGCGAFWRTRVQGTNVERPARVSRISTLSESLMCATSVQGFAEIGKLDAYLRLQSRVAAERGWGDCYGHILVATGRAEVMLDPAMDVWDCAALRPILEEAGGTFTDLQGIATHRGSTAMSTNRFIFEEVMAALCQVESP